VISDAQYARLQHRSRFMKGDHIVGTYPDAGADTTNRATRRSMQPVWPRCGRPWHARTSCQSICQCYSFLADISAAIKYKPARTPNPPRTAICCSW